MLEGHLTINPDHTGCHIVHHAPFPYRADNMQTVAEE